VGSHPLLKEQRANNKNEEKTTMTTIDATTGSSNVYAVGGLTGATGLSPDALLEYCQSQLGCLDTQIKHSIDHQNLELLERQAAETAQGVLEQFGDKGPQSTDDMQNCVDALNKAIASLPAGDPVAAKLETFKNDMCNKYGFTEAQAARPLTPDEQKQYDKDKVITADVPNKNHENPGYAQASGEIRHFNKIMSGLPANLDDSKKPQNSEWKGTCDALASIVGDIKSGAEIQMLSLQDLVSQRQQAVSLACNMMSKEDTSLEQLARLGQG
jgi:hypothetical protein